MSMGHEFRDQTLQHAALFCRTAEMWHALVDLDCELADLRREKSWNDMSVGTSLPEAVDASALDKLKSFMGTVSKLKDGPQPFGASGAAVNQVHPSEQRMNEDDALYQRGVNDGRKEASEEALSRLAKLESEHDALKAQNGQLLDALNKKNRDNNTLLEACAQHSAAREELWKRMSEVRSKNTELEHKINEQRSINSALRAANVRLVNEKYPTEDAKPFHRTEDTVASLRERVGKLEQELAHERSRRQGV